MSGSGAGPWAALFLLGAYHGVNPGMGWLFAVALGMQERRRAAVWRALAPITLGHALAIAAAVLAAAAAGRVLRPSHLKWPIAGLLIALGLYRLWRQRHPRFGGMRVGPLDLTLWSFLMASAHGAGLMVLPVVLGMEGGTAGVHAGHAGAAGLAHELPLGVAYPLPLGVSATLVHTAGYLLVTALVAALVYEKLGVALLRRAWINLDLVWAAALIVTGIATTLL